MERSAKPERGGGSGRVMGDAVGDEDRAADPLGRGVAQRLLQRAE